MMRSILKRLAFSMRDNAGVTLVEMIVVTGIVSVSVGLVGGGIFQVLSIQRTWRDDVSATRELRHAESWIARDAFNTMTTDLIADDPSVDTMTLQWTDSTETVHTVVYGLSGPFLERTEGSEVTQVARAVTAVGFSLSGQTLTFDLTVEAESGGTESTNLETYLRTLQ